MYSHIYFGFRS